MLGSGVLHSFSSCTLLQYSVTMIQAGGTEQLASVLHMYKLLIDMCTDVRLLGDPISHTTTELNPRSIKISHSLPGSLAPSTAAT